MQIMSLLIIFSACVFAQFRVLNPHPTQNTLYLGSAPSANKYITVTGQDEAIYTNDGGLSWNTVQIGGQGIYRSCFFLNDNLGWAVGSFAERLHKTTNGGASWIHQPNAPDTTKYDVFFISESIGWSVGFNGFIIKTTNGGDNWFSQSNTSLTTKTLYGVTATDVNHVFVAGNGDAVLRSTDGGNSWSLNPPIFATSTDYRSFCFPPTGTGNLGFLVGSKGRIAKTTDGGQSWTSSYDPGNSVDMWAVSFADGNTGLACGSGSTVLRTTNGGLTWLPINGWPSSSIVFYSVRFGDANTAYLSGSSGYIFKSTDAGVSWSPLGYRFTNNRVKDVSFCDNQNGYVVGTQGLIAKSSNGGNSFSVQTSSYTGDVNEVSTVSPSLAFAAAKQGTVLRTTDGNNWTVLNTGIGNTIELLGIDFPNNNYGWVAGTNGTVYKTTNSGETWFNQTITTTSLLWDMDFVDTLYGWIVGTGEKIFATTDGGNTWTEQFSGGGLGLYGVSFINRDLGIAAGTSGNTYYTTNGGITWNPANTPPGNTVWGVDYKQTATGSIALAACASGYVYKSTDGGINWTAMPRYTISTFDDVCFSDAANAWIVGNSGLVLKYFEPGNVPVELVSFTLQNSAQGVLINWITATETNAKEFLLYRKRETEKSFSIIHRVPASGNSLKEITYSFLDADNFGKVSYRLVQTDFDGTEHILVDNKEINIVTSDDFLLLNNYPNPFNPETTLRFVLMTETVIKIELINSLGEIITEFPEELYPAGNHNVTVNFSNLGSGMYFARFSAYGKVLGINKLLFQK